MYCMYFVNICLLFPESIIVQYVETALKQIYIILHVISYKHENFTMLSACIDIKYY